MIPRVAPSLQSAVAMQHAPALESTEPSPFERLFHRWFVQYNPLYLVSAMFVLVGLTMISRALAGDLSLSGQLGVGAASELYALALIGGAALLMRLGLPRPATFVALLAVLYQGDLALTTETHALLGTVGKLASATWFLLFVAKLHALARAMRLRVSPSAWLVASLGALGLAVVPHLSRSLGRGALTAVVGLWLFAVLASALWTPRTVRSKTPRDAWGQTVERRALRATWTIWACLALAHAVLWCREYHLDAGVLVPIALLLATRWMRGEIATLATASATLAFVAVAMPAVLPAVALMAAAVLSLGAWRVPARECDRSASPPDESGYRGAGEPIATVLPAFEFPAGPERARRLAWAGYALYVAAWTCTRTSGDWPDHVLALDLTLTVPMLLVAWGRRSVAVPAPLFATYVHWAIQSRLLRAPQSTLQWGITTVSVGFALLFVSVFTSWRFERRPPPVVTEV